MENRGKERRREGGAETRRKGLKGGGMRESKEREGGKLDGKVRGKKTPRKMESRGKGEERSKVEGRGRKLRKFKKVKEKGEGKEKNGRKVGSKEARWKYGGKGVWKRIKGREKTQTLKGRREGSREGGDRKGRRMEEKK